MAMRDSGGDLDHMVADSFSGLFDGKVCVSAGFIKEWPWRGVAWALIDRNVTKQMMIPVHRAVMQAIESYQPTMFHRLEMAVRHDVREAHRWAKMLGFTPEGIMRKYDELGRDYTLYARVRQ